MTHFDNEESLQIPLDPVQDAVPRYPGVMPYQQAMVKVWEKWTQFGSCPRRDAGASFFQLFSNF